MKLNIKHGPHGIVYNEEFKDMLTQNNLFDFDRVMSLKDGEVIKHAVAERKTVKLSCNHESHMFEVYLKRHYPLSLKKLVSQVFKLSPSKTALDEFNNIVAFHLAGIPTMVPIAAGIRRAGFFRKKSFIVSKALDGCVRMDHFFSGRRDVPALKRRAIIKKVALLIRKMHGCGFNHRDLYLCHILFDCNDSLFLLDLHRVDRRKEVPLRWKVKDIAALNYSAPLEAVSRADRLFFLKTYLGLDCLNKAGKSFVHRVVKKTEKMVSHNTDD